MPSSFVESFSVSLGHAESIESIARHGRVRTLVCLLDADDTAQELRALRGPDLAISRLGSRRTKERQNDARSVLNGLRPIAISLCSDLDVEDEAVQRLMHLSKLDDVEIYVGRDFATPNDFTHVRSWRLEPSLEDHPDTVNFGAVVQNESSITTYGIFLQREWQSLAIHISGDVANAEAIWIDLLFHQAIGTDLLVTTNPKLIDQHRYKSSGLAAHSGIATPREAVSTIEAILRSRGTVVAVLEHGFTSTVDVGSFRAAISEARMPHAWAAMRSALSPTRRDTQRRSADRMLSMLATYEDLLAAVDDLMCLRLIEGDRDGDNSVLDRIVYHARQAVTLTTTCLDCLAWTVADIEGQPVERHKVAWRALRTPSPWVKSLEDPDAQLIADAARTHPHGKVMDFVHHLRDSTIHRQPLAGASLEVRSSDLRPDVRGDFVISVIGVEASITPVDAEIPTDLPGLTKVADAHYIIPHLFGAGLALQLADLLDDTLGSVEWQGSDEWWQLTTPLDRKLHSQLVEIAPWLLGDSRAT